MPTALIAFGSNVGDSRSLYQDVQKVLATGSHGVELVRASDPIETKPVGGEETETAHEAPKKVYLNAALLIETELSPQKLIAELLEIEKQMGRVRDKRWGPRTVDLDLLLYEDRVIDEIGLICPHPRMSFRRFELEPAGEIAAEMIHPVTRSSLQSLLSRLDNRPNLILWLGELLPEFHKPIFERATPLGQNLKLIECDQWYAAKTTTDQFSICEIKSAEQFSALADEAKLLVIPAGIGLETNLADKVISFLGAKLKVDPSRIDLVKEIHGAVDSMV